MISGASSPRVSLARTSPRTRYCCPRLLGSTRSRMSPSRRPPTLVSGESVRVTALRRTDVCAFEPGPAPRKHAPRKQCTPSAPWGPGGFIAPPGQFRAGFSEQQQEPKIDFLASRNPKSVPDTLSASHFHGFGCRTAAW